MLLPISCSTVTLNTPINAVAKDYVLFLVLSGSISMRCNDDQFDLNVQDVVLIDPGMDFSAKTETNNVLIRIEIGASFLAETYQTSDFSVRCNSVLFPGDHLVLVRKILALAREVISDTDEGWTPKACARAFDLLDTLWHDYCTVFGPDVYDGDVDERQYESVRKEQIQRYIQLHYQDPISLTTMADYVHLTPQYLSKFFKKQFGIGFLKYLTQLRLSNAYTDLSETDKPITKVAMDCGFSNLSSFNKAFKETYGLSPKGFRAARAVKPAQNPFTVLTGQETEPYLLLPEDPALEDGAQILPENVAVSVNCSEKTFVRYEKFWEQIINVGAAENCLLHGLREQLEGLTQKVRFRYARMGRLFNERLLCLSEQGVLVGLNIFADIINLLRRANLTPFLVLEMTYPFLAAEQVRRGAHLKYGEAYSDNQWELMLEQFVRYCMNTWGEDVVGQWCFELTLPELSVHELASVEPKWAELYARRLRITKKIIHHYVPNAKVGGPGISLDVGFADNLEQLFGKIARQKIVPDFISSYLYPTYCRSGEKRDPASLDELSIVYPSNGHIAGRIGQAKALAEAAFDCRLPFYVTEFGCDRTNKCSINDTVYASAFIAKTVVDTFGEIDALGYCNLTDTTVGRRKNNRLLFGGQGMLTQENIKKSAFYVYWLMAKLGDRLVQTDQNYMITSRRPDCYELLVHNFKGVNEAFCRGYFQKAQPQFHYESALEDMRALNVHVDLCGLRTGEYRVKYYFLNRDHGDLEKATNELLTFTNMDVRSEEVEYLSNICLPQQSLMMAAVSDGKLPFDLYLEPNEICLISVILRSS